MDDLSTSQLHLGEPTTPNCVLALQSSAGPIAMQAKRDKAAARRFFEKAIGQNGSPETVTVDKSEANLAALHAVNAGRETVLRVRPHAGRLTIPSRE